MQFRDRIKELRRVHSSMLRPNPRNWRTHPQAQQDALRGVLAEVGIADAVLARECEDGGLMLLDGHLRVETLPDAEIPVLILDVTEAEGDKILATLDPLAAMAEADANKLDELLREVETGSQALADMLTELADEAGVLDDEQKEVVEDEVPEVPVEPVTKPGDLWILGEHRLLCGDSTRTEDVARLLGGERARLVFTDPPYNCGDEMSAAFYQNANSPAMRGLAAAQWDRGFDMAAFLAVLNANTPVDGSVYVCTSHMLAPQVWAWMAGSEASHSSYVVWCKPNPMPSLAKRHWTWATELICYATFGRHVFNFPPEGHALSYWTVNKNAANELHATQKPVAIPEMAIRASSNPGDLVVDFFLGSGTTLVAAEQLGRKCYGVEISPQYCDVIVKRWENLTGKKAVLEQVASKKATRAKV